MDPVELLADKSTVGQIILLVATLLGTVATIWKSGQNAKLTLAMQTQTSGHQLELLRLQHEMEVADRREKAALDREERATLAAKVVSESSTVRDRVDLSAVAVRDRLDLAEQVVKAEAIAVRERLENKASEAITKVGTAASTLLAEQTDSLKAAIEAAKLFTADKADAAFHEANSVNLKIERLQQQHEAQSKIIINLLAALNAGDVTNASVDQPRA